MDDERIDKIRKKIAKARGFGVLEDTVFGREAAELLEEVERLWSVLSKAAAFLEAAANEPMKPTTDFILEDGEVDFAAWKFYVASRKGRRELAAKALQMMREEAG